MPALPMSSFASIAVPVLLCVGVAGGALGECVYECHRAGMYRFGGRSDVHLDLYRMWLYEIRPHM